MELLFVFKLFIVFCMDVNMLEFEFEKGFVMNFLHSDWDRFSIVSHLDLANNTLMVVLMR